MNDASRRLLALTILLVVLAYLFTSRFEPIGDYRRPLVLDRWTGSICELSASGLLCYNRERLP